MASTCKCKIWDKLSFGRSNTSVEGTGKILCNTSAEGTGKILCDTKA